jgi:hypothetical protein
MRNLHIIHGFYPKTYHAGSRAPLLQTRGRTVYSQRERISRGIELKPRDGRFAVIRRLLILTVVAGLAIQTAFSQSPGSDSVKPLKSGETVQLADGLSFKVTRIAKSPFTEVKLRGQAVVVVLDLDAGRKSATISYQLSANPKLSEIYLADGAQKIAPFAVIEDFPSWGSDNDKEVEILDPAEKAAGVNLNFEKKGSISLLFDVPLEQAKTPQKLSIKIRAVKPSDELHSFVVNL